MKKENLFKKQRQTKLPATFHTLSDDEEIPFFIQENGPDFLGVTLFIVWAKGQQLPEI